MPCCICIHGAFLHCIYQSAVVSGRGCIIRDAPFFVVLPKILKEPATVKQLFLFVLLLLSLPLFSAEIKGKVVGVTDGDTIKVLDDLDKGLFRIRLDKIDAPEKNQAFGQKSKQYLSNLVFGKQVTIRYKAVDRYGRILGTVFCNGVEINLVMVQNGYAWHYSCYDKTSAYIQAEKQSRIEKKGLWADPKPIKPCEFRKVSRGARRI